MSPDNPDPSDSPLIKKIINRIKKQFINSNENSFDAEAYEQLDTPRKDMINGVVMLSELNAKDIMMFSKMMEERAHNMQRLRAFWDEEMACMTRIYSHLAVPFSRFFIDIMNAAGDIAIDRKKDPQYTDEEEKDVIHIVKAKQ